MRSNDLGMFVCTCGLPSTVVCPILHMSVFVCYLCLELHWPPPQYLLSNVIATLS